MSCVVSSVYAVCSSASPVRFVFLLLCMFLFLLWVSSNEFWVHILSPGRRKPSAAIWDQMLLTTQCYEQFFNQMQNIPHFFSVLSNKSLIHFGIGDLGFFCCCLLLFFVVVVFKKAFCVFKALKKMCMILTNSKLYFNPRWFCQ